MVNPGEPEAPRRMVVPTRLRDLWRQHPLWVLAPSAILALAVTVAVLWPVTDLIAAHDVGLITGPKRAPALQAAREAVRTQLLTLGAGVFAAGALVYTALNFRLSRGTLEATRNTVRLVEEGQVTDRYTKAVKQLGSDKLEVRIGGIYALERIARDSARDHPAVMDVLAAFIRERSRDQWPLPESDEDEPPARSTRPDVQTAITVIGRRDCSRDRPRRGSIILSGANLPGADLTGADLSGADLTGVNLGPVWSTRTPANLNGVNLSGANLSKASLVGANLEPAEIAGQHTPANLSGANLSGANLSEARLVGANLKCAEVAGKRTRTNLSHANLRGVTLTDAILTHADLRSADLSPAGERAANLRGAHLDDALLSDAHLDRAHLEGANLARARLRNATLSHAKLAGADLRGADLESAKFESAKLMKADLQKTILTKTDLSGADLDEANFTDAEISHAKFLGAQHADYTGALLIDGPPPRLWVADRHSGRLSRVSQSPGRSAPSPG